VLGAMGIDTNNQDVTFAGNLAASDPAALGGAADARYAEPSRSDSNHWRVLTLARRDDQSWWKQCAGRWR